MRYYVSIKKITNIIIFFYFLLKLCYNECMTHSFPGLLYPKALTLNNSFQLLLTSTGIFSFYPKLTKVSFSYNFTSEQKMDVYLTSMKNTVNQNEISQFSEEEGGKKYVICLAKYYLYLLDEKGNMLTNQKLTEIETEYVHSLVAYKYSDKKYYFVIAYNSHDKFNDEYSLNYLNTFYYEIEKEGNQYEIKLDIEKKEIHPTFPSIEKYSIKPKCISCQMMNSPNYGKVLTCFEKIAIEINFDGMKKYAFIALNFNPDNNFNFLYKSNNNLEDTEIQSQNYFKSVVNNDRTKALICYAKSSNDLKCIYYDISTNELKTTGLITNYCSLEYYGFNLYYFKKPNEYILGCINIYQNTFYFYLINENFAIVYCDRYINQYTFNNCNILNFFTIIYISKYDVYSVIINSYCDEGDNIRIFMLSTNTCIMPNNEKEDDDENNKQIMTTIPLDITTLPKEIIISTNPKIIDTTFPYIESTFIETCEDNRKIFYEGNCICDTTKEYYYFNLNSHSKTLNDKCYKINELPKNVFYEPTTKSYELCYKTCATCNQGGSSIENNCLTCIVDYIFESEKNSSNCVEECEYFYFYDSLNQYTCSEDEQCPDGASLIIRDKNKCISKCPLDETNKYQYNGECLTICPPNTNATEDYICQISNTSSCTSSEFKLNLEETVSRENVKLAAKNYAYEFYYTLNHISKYIGSDFTMVLYKNSSCIDYLKLNITKIEYDSCIHQLKIDNNIDENKDLIIAVIDVMSGNNPITSFGFFNPDTGEKLDASKSCSDKSVKMYEDILTILNDPLAIDLLEKQKINIFDLNDEFYKDICFHFNSPNGKDATLQDRIKSFYPNVTLCDAKCKNKGVNITTLKAECECTFQDLLSKNIFENDLFRDNVFIKESLQEIADMINNLNLEVLACYKDVFDFKYFKKNKGGFIVIGIFILYTICIIVYSTKSKNKMIRFIYSILEKYIFYIKRKNKKNDNSEQQLLHSPTKKNNKKENNKGIKNNKNIIKEKVKKFVKNEKKEENNKRKEKNKRKINFKQINIINFNFKDLKKKKLKDKEKEKLINLSRSSGKLPNLQINKKNIITNKQKKNNTKLNYLLIKNDIDMKKYLESSPEYMEYDDVIEEDKRTFCQYIGEKIKYNQLIINTFIIHENIKPKSIKIALFIVIIDIYFLTDGLFYSNSYISQIFNSNEKETLFSFIPRGIDRFIYTTIIGNIIEYIINFFFVEEIKIKKILIKNEKNLINLKYEIPIKIKSIIKYIKILIIINYIIIIFSWYYLSCFNNIYPNINNEWILSSIFIIVVMQILYFISTIFEASLRFLSIKFESEKLFKLSLFLS